MSPAKKKERVKLMSPAGISPGAVVPTLFWVSSAVEQANQ